MPGAWRNASCCPKEREQRRRVDTACEHDAVRLEAFDSDVERDDPAPADLQGPHLAREPHSRTVTPGDSEETLGYADRIGMAVERRMECCRHRSRIERRGDTSKPLGIEPGDGVRRAVQRRRERLDCIGVTGIGGPVDIPSPRHAEAERLIEPAPTPDACEP